MFFSLFRRSFCNNVKKMHYKCRNATYARSPGVERAFIPEEKVEWSVPWEEYRPVPYTAPHILKQPWADPELGPSFAPKWNSLDGNVNRVSSTLQREFLEEALNALEQRQEDAERLVSDFFTQGREVYRGYVDDPRNTDNAWMETTAVNFHDAEGGAVGRLPLQAGDDAQGVCWMDVGRELKLYASHTDFLRLVAQWHSAHW